jgi:hypothetical protein
VGRTLQPSYYARATCAALCQYIGCPYQPCCLLVPVGSGYGGMPVLALCRSRAWVVVCLEMAGLIRCRTRVSRERDELDGLRRVNAHGREEAFY